MYLTKSSTVFQSVNTSKFFLKIVLILENVWHPWLDKQPGVVTSVSSSSIFVGRGWKFYLPVSSSSLLLSFPNWFLQMWPAGLPNTFQNAVKVRSWRLSRLSWKTFQVISWLWLDKRRCSSWLVGRACPNPCLMRRSRGWNWPTWKTKFQKTSKREDKTIEFLSDQVGLAFIYAFLNHTVLYCHWSKRFSFLSSQFCSTIFNDSSLD